MNFWDIMARHYGRATKREVEAVEALKEEVKALREEIKVLREKPQPQPLVIPSPYPSPYPVYVEKQTPVYPQITYGTTSTSWNDPTGDNIFTVVNGDDDECADTVKVG